LARHGDDEQFCVGEGVIQQHGVGVQRGLELLQRGRFWVEQVSVVGKLLAQLVV
jgi:hypothetical protein